MNVVCLLNDYVNNYIINKNEIILDNNDILKQPHKYMKIGNSCKFDKIHIDPSISLDQCYDQEIINLLDVDLSESKHKKNLNTILLLGDIFDTFVVLFIKLFDKFTYESDTFNFYVHEINSTGSYDFISGHSVNIEEQKNKNFTNSKIFLNPSNHNFSEKREEIIETVIKKYKEIDSPYYIIMTFENSHNKITIYNLSQIEFNIEYVNSNSINPLNYFMLSDYNYLKSTLLNINFNKIFKESVLMNYYCHYPKDVIKIIYNITKFSPKIFNFVTFFYNNKSDNLYGIFLRNFNTVPIPKLLEEKPSKYTNGISHVIIPNRKNHDLKLIKKPNTYNYNKKILNQINKQIKKNPANNLSGYISDDESPNWNTHVKSYEIIKYIPEPENPDKLFNEILSCNTVLFNHCVKTHIKLQKVNKQNHENNKVKIINEIIRDLYTALITTTDYLHKFI